MLTIPEESKPEELDDLDHMLCEIPETLIDIVVLCHSTSATTFMSTSFACTMQRHIVRNAYFACVCVLPCIVRFLLPIWIHQQAALGNMDNPASLHLLLYLHYYSHRISIASK